MHERRLEHMGRNHVVETGTCARDFRVGDNIRLGLEASDCGGVFDSLMFRQRAPGRNLDQYQNISFPCSTDHSRRYSSLSRVHPEVRPLKVLKIYSLYLNCHSLICRDAAACELLL